MLKKLRWRFITISMIAFSAVIIVLLLVINIFTYQNTTKQLNKTKPYKRRNNRTSTRSFRQFPIS